MSTRQVADVLGVSIEAVRKMIKSGRLPVAGMSGKRVLVSALSVQQIFDTPTRTGRIWSPRTAWTAISILEGREELPSHPFEISRIYNALSRVDAGGFHQLARARAIVRRFQWDAKAAAHLKALSEPCGAQALARLDCCDGDRSSPQRVDEGYEGYIYPSMMQNALRIFDLRPDPAGAIVLRVIQFPRRPSGASKPFEGKVPRVIVAVDLMDDVDARNYELGTSYLQNALDGWRDKRLKNEPSM